MTSQELETLYSKLRANSLARHFAIGRYWRRNIWSEESHLGNKTNLLCGPTYVRPRKADGSLLYPNVAGLFQQNRNNRLLPERWRVAMREHANPLLQSGIHLTQLAIEAKLGNRESLKIIDLSLKTIDSLYKFKNDPIFGGYILRYDPVTCDNWVEYPKPNQPFFCCNFLPNLDPPTFKDNQYNYSTPDQDSMVQSAVNRAGDAEPARYKLWEPSFDEITGLLGGYFMIWSCLKDDPSEQAITIVNKVKTQSDRLGRYLRDTDYILVKPNKGFTYYGCTGVGSLLEIMFSRAFSRINDRPFDFYRQPNNKHTFEDALKLAGVWTDFNKMLLTLLPPGSPEFPLRTEFPLPPLPQWLVDAFDSILINVFGVHFRELGDLFNGPGFRSALPNIGINTLYVLANYQVFNLGGNAGTLATGFDDVRLEFAIGYLLKRLMEIDEHAVYKAFFKVILPGPPEGFKPWLGLFALGDEDPFYKDCYLEWFNSLPVETGTNEVYGTAKNKAFYSAVALLLDASMTTEIKLDAQLLTMFNTLQGGAEESQHATGPELPGYNSDLVIKDTAGDIGGDEPYVAELMDSLEHYYGFNLPLSLKWLYHSDRSQGCLGSILPWFFRWAETPTIDSMSSWPKATLPKEVISSLSDFTRENGNDYEVPLQYLPLEYTRVGISANYFRPGPGGGHPFVDIDLFEDPTPIPTVNEVSHLPPPISTAYPIDMPPLPVPFYEIPYSFSEPALPQGLPRENYTLVWSLKTLEELGSSISPISYAENGNIEFTILVRSTADWIESPMGAGIYIPTNIKFGFYKGTFYFAWVYKPL
jgi:hypothetical protein